MLVAGLLMLLKMFTLIVGARLRGELRRKGFTEVTLFDAEELWLRLLWRAKRVPNFDELATVPGVDPHKMPSIEGFMRSQRKDRLS